MKRYAVMVKVYAGAGFKWATPWTFDTYAEAQEAAKLARASCNYEAVKVRVVVTAQPRDEPGSSSSGAEGGGAMSGEREISQGAVMVLAILRWESERDEPVRPQELARRMGIPADDAAGYLAELALAGYATVEVSSSGTGGRDG